MDFYDRISNDLQKNDGCVDCIFLESKKASDTVTSRTLMMKLDIQDGVRGDITGVDSYATGRKKKRDMITIYRFLEGYNNVILIVLS